MADPRGEVNEMVFEEGVVLSQPFDEATASVKASLAESGYGTLSEIDVQATLREKLDKQIGRFVIIGACNPSLAGRALDVEPEVGVLLPCNVVLREIDGDKVLVEAMDPGLIATLSGNEELRPIIDESRRLLGEALNRLSPVAVV
ncbi:MAG: DUF302 domain-containing protein [Actinomycetota bacterium]|nr:DUF302 domain-containing protein [Actinomycetota bacterium]